MADENLWSQSATERAANPGREPRWHRALPIGALIALAFAHVCPLLLTGRVLAKNDYGSSAIPAFASLQGHLPIAGAPSWTPAVFGGAPEEVLAAMPRYPLNALAYAMPPENSLPIFIALHLAIAGLAAWGFVRRVGGASRVAALFGAMVYAFGGALWLRGQHPDYLAVAAWMPAVLRAAWEIVATGSLARRRRFAALLALSGGMILLTGGGAPIVVLVVLCAVAVTLDATAHRNEAGTPRLRALADALPWLALGGVAGIFIGAPGLVPFVEAVRGGARGALSLRESGAFSLTPPSLLRLLVPDLLIGGEWYWPEFVERWLYAGVLTLALCLLGARSPRGRTMLLWAVLAVMLGLGLSAPLHWILYFALPGYSHFRAPGRWGIVAVLALAALAARGLDAILRDGAIRGPARVTAALFAALAALALAVALAGRPDPTLDLARGGLVFFAVQAALAAAWMFAATLEVTDRRDAIAIAAMILLATDLGGTVLRLHLPEPPATLAEPAAFEIAAKAAGSGRIGSDDGAGSKPLNNGLRWGYRNARGYSQIVPDRYARLLDLGRAPGPLRHLAPIRPDARLLRLLGIGAWVGAAGAPAPPGFVPVAVAGDSAVWRSGEAPFVAALVAHVEVAGDPASTRALALALDPRTAAVVEEPVALPAADPGPAGTAVLERRGTDEILVHVDAERDALLVVADAFHPRWSAAIDGAPAPILRADAIWRGVVVRKGSHEVLFQCRAAAPWWTWLLMLAGTGGTVMLAAPRGLRRMKAI